MRGLTPHLPLVGLFAATCAGEPASPPAEPAPAAALAAEPRRVPPSPSPAAPATGDLEVEVRRLDTSAGEPVVLLGPGDGSLVVPISIGAAEALAIATELEGVKPPRPMTHDLMRDLLDVFEARLTAVRVTEVRDHTFYARLVLAAGGNTYDVDSRPSDAIALALRARAPIYLAAPVVAAAAIRRPAGPGRTVTGLPGLTVQALSPALARGFGLEEPRGALVAEVEPDSPAARAGLLPGDVIVEVSGVRVEGPGDLAARVVPETAPELVVLRSGRRSEIRVPEP